MDKNALSLEISPHLLWEYDLSNFDYDRSKRIVIERVIERGNIKDWQEIKRYYGVTEILEVAKSSKQLSKKDKDFTEIFVHSGFLHAV